VLPAGAIAGWDLHPLENAALPRRTPQADIRAPWTHLLPALKIPNLPRVWEEAAA